MCYLCNLDNYHKLYLNLSSLVEVEEDDDIFERNKYLLIKRMFYQFGYCSLLYNYFIIVCLDVLL